MSEFCRSCKVAVVFALMPSGKWMPLDAQTSLTGEWRLFGDLPRAVYVEPERREELAGQLHLSHFATCPFADEHRSPR